MSSGNFQIRNLTKNIYSNQEVSRIDVRHLESQAPQQIYRKGFHDKGRPRTFPVEPIRPTDLKDFFNKPLNEMTYLQRKTYNRLASRRTYAKEKIIAQEGFTAKEYKKKLNKKIKDFTKKEKKEYNRLAKIQERIEKDLSY
jgi:hypothetical protein